VNSLMIDAGYRNVHEGGTRRWRVVLYRTEEPDPSVDRVESDEIGTAYRIRTGDLRLERAVS
jgi:hypothetical protein